MKSQLNANLAVRLSLALAVALALLSPLQVRSAEPAKEKVMMEAKMMERCQEMKAQKQKMMAEMKAQDDHLTDQIAQMNRAPTDKKMELMASVLTHLVEQRVSMRVQKSKMEEQMMQHMMQHMQMGAESMSKCPMMKAMKDTDGTPADAHKDHLKQ